MSVVYDSNTQIYLGRMVDDVLRGRSIIKTSSTSEGPDLTLSSREEEKEEREDELDMIKVLGRVFGRPFKQTTSHGSDHLTKSIKDYNVWRR